MISYLRLQIQEMGEDPASPLSKTKMETERSFTVHFCVVFSVHPYRTFEAPTLYGGLILDAHLMGPSF